MNMLTSTVELSKRASAMQILTKPEEWIEVEKLFGKEGE